MQALMDETLCNCFILCYHVNPRPEQADAGEEVLCLKASRQSRLMLSSRVSGWKLSSSQCLTLTFYMRPANI